MNLKCYIFVIVSGPVLNVQSDQLHQVNRQVWLFHAKLELFVHNFTVLFELVLQLQVTRHESSSRNSAL